MTGSLASLRWDQQTLAEMAAAETAMSCAFAMSLDTAATIALSDVVSAATSPVASVTAALISVGEGDEVGDCAPAVLVTVAEADFSAATCARRAAAAAGSLPPAVAAWLAPALVARSPAATPEQLRVSLGYAAARTALRPLRAAVRPEVDDAFSPSSTVLDLSTFTRAASVFSAAASAGSVVVTVAAVVDDVVVEGCAVDDDEVDADPVGGGPPASEPHPTKRQATSAVVTSVLRCMESAPHHILGGAAAPILASPSTGGVDSGDIHPSEIACGPLDRAPEKEEG